MLTVLATSVVACGGGDYEGTAYGPDLSAPERVTSTTGGTGTDPTQTVESTPGSPGTGAFCSAGLTQCGQVCVDTEVSSQNCGACGRACAAGQFCAPADGTGVPTCAVSCTGGTVRCGGTNACTRLVNDPQNCGACGRACGGNQACVNGACAGLACTPGAQELCFSGNVANVGVGACRSGIKTCNAQGTAFGACVGERLPSAEICNNGVDEDCDGVVDDGCAPTMATLTVSVSGTETVYSSPAGIQCGNGYTACTAQFPVNSGVTLSASPAGAGTHSWSGACATSGASSMCSLAMTTSQSVGATFTPSAPPCGGRADNLTYRPGTTLYLVGSQANCATDTIVTQTYTTCPMVTSVTVNNNYVATLTSSVVSGTTRQSVYSLSAEAASQPISSVLVRTASPTVNCPAVWTLQ